jgi:hypothetical protein
VRADAPIINTTNAEVGVRFDTTRHRRGMAGSARQSQPFASADPGLNHAAGPRALVVVTNSYQLMTARDLIHDFG